jgi:hypothetical protein
MRRFVFFAFIVVLGSFTPQVLMQPDVQVMQAAEGQMDVYLDKIQPGQQAKFGFTNEDDLDLCSIGKPYRVLEFKKDFFDCKQLDDNADYIDIKWEWRVPVILKGVHKVLLTVNGNPGNYSVSGMADPDLARELQVKCKGLSDNDAFYILRVPPLSAVFFVHETNNSLIEAQFFPLESAIKAIPALGKTNKAFYSLAETENLVKDAVLLKAKDVSQPGQKKKISK